MTFKAGDTVVFSKPRESNVAYKGQRATVMPNVYSKDGTFLYVKWHDRSVMSENNDGGWFVDQFELAEPPKPAVDYLSITRELCGRT